MMGSLRRIARPFVFRHVGGTAVVLIYHRVGELERDPQALAIAPHRFEAHMREVAAHYRPVSLSALVFGLARRRVPDRAVAVTFDDGYADNLTAAAPILDRCGVPATMFVSSGYVGGAREFWWDEVDRLVLAPGMLPESLALQCDGASFEATLAETATYTPEDADWWRGWDVTQAGGGERQSLYRDLCSFIRPLSASARENVLGQLRDLAGVAVEVRPTHRSLTEQELRDLDAAPGIEVGGHTVSHQSLFARTEAEQRDEIAADRKRLAEMLDHDVRLFSYPYGSLADYDATTVNLVCEAGYVAACSNHSGVIKPWTDSFRIPRTGPRDVEGPVFAAYLERWFDEPR